MGKFDLRKIKAEMEKDYEKAWLMSKSLLKEKGRLLRLKPQGKPHPIFAFIEKARHVLLRLGFKETVLPMIVEEGTIFREYGPEACLILDRVFYLAGLPRPDIGISNEKLQEIQEIIPGFDKVSELQKIFREYKASNIEADNMLDALVSELGLKEDDASKMIDSVFPEFKKLEPVPTRLTLRSHTTALWFPALAKIQHQQLLPVQLFSIGPKFRREQRLDSTHLYSSYTISFVIMATEITLEDGKTIVEDFLREIGYETAVFTQKRVTSKYYAPQTESEIFTEHPKTGELIEIGDLGFYSPIALANFGIEYPVFNAGFGVERFAMIETGETDIRRLVYPYFYTTVDLKDEELLKGIRLTETPETDLGKEIMEAIITIAEEHKDDSSPTKVLAWQKPHGSQIIQIYIWEPDSGVKLLGPAALNEIWVSDGNIIGIIPTERLRQEGIPTGIRYLDAIAAKAAKDIEELLKKGKNEYMLRIKMVKNASDINLTIEESIRRVISSKEKKVDIRGPTFIGILMEAHPLQET
ncbi:MAG: O-phosphoserine--tRNA ligase [Promethearchaeota archaeon]